MKRVLKMALVFLLLLVAGGYLLVSYWPRERAGAPQPGSLPARLLASGEYGACLWIPYPHQNLGSLAGSIGDGPEYLAACDVLASPHVPRRLLSCGSWLPCRLARSRTAPRPRAKCAYRSGFRSQPAG